MLAPALEPGARCSCDDCDSVECVRCEIVVPLAKARRLATGWHCRPCASDDPVILERQRADDNEEE